MRNKVTLSFPGVFYQTIKVQTGPIWDKQPITDSTEKWVLHPSHKNTDIKFQKPMHCGQLHEVSTGMSSRNVC